MRPHPWPLADAHAYPVLLNHRTASG
jgi:hypothetical protein